MVSATTFVDQGDVLAVRAVLECVEQLFVAPEFDPFADQVRSSAVVDDIVAYLHARRLRRPPQVTLTLLLPAVEMSDGLAPAVRTAMQRYAAYHLAKSKQSLEISTFEGLARLPWGIAVAVVAVVLMLLLNMTLPDDLDQLLVGLSPVITVIVWVAIWNPTESLLYDNWGLRREITLAEILDKIEIDVKAQ